jgi:hypothetical protein
MRLKWKLDSFRLEILLILMQDGCTICVEHTAGSDIILDVTDILGDVGHMESIFGTFGDSVSIGARYVHCLRQTYPRLRNRLGRTRWYF